MCCERFAVNCDIGSRANGTWSDPSVRAHGLSEKAHPHNGKECQGPKRETRKQRDLAKLMMTASVYAMTRFNTSTVMR